MILDQFLLDLVARGASLRIENDRLIFRGPPGSIRACDGEFIRENRAELLDRVRSAGPIEPVVEEADPAWLDDAALTIRTADARASIEAYEAAEPSASRPARPTDRNRRAGRTAPGRVESRTAPTSPRSASEKPTTEDGGVADGQSQAT